MSNITEFLKSKRARRQAELAPTEHDGLLLGAVKAVFRFDCYDVLCFRFCDAFLRLTAAKSQRTPEFLDKKFFVALDVYTLGWLAINVVLYAIAWWSVESQRWVGIVVPVACILGLCRFIELWSVIAIVHLSFVYEPARMMRSVIHTVINYWAFTFFRRGSDSR